MLPGLKFPDAHAHTPICQTYTQARTYAIKVRHSKPRFFRFAHKGNRVRLCHFPSQTSARVCLAPGLRGELAHTEPPCVRAFIMPTHSHLCAQCDVPERPRLWGVQGSNVDPRTQWELAFAHVRACLGFEEGAEEAGFGFQPPLFRQQRRSSTLRSELGV